MIEVYQWTSDDDEIALDAITVGIATDDHALAQTAGAVMMVQLVTPRLSFRAQMPAKLNGDCR